MGGTKTGSQLATLFVTFSSVQVQTVRTIRFQPILSGFWVINFEKPCSVFSSGMKVKIKEIEKYTYPDIVVVVCENEEYEDENDDILLNPLVIIEILSNSTEAYDRGDKFSNYQLRD